MSHIIIIEFHGVLATVDVSNGSDHADAAAKIDVLNWNNRTKEDLVEFAKWAKENEQGNTSGSIKISLEESLEFRAAVKTKLIDMKNRKIGKGGCLPFDLKLGDIQVMEEKGWANLESLVQARNYKGALNFIESTFLAYNKLVSEYYKTQENMVNGENENREIQNILRYISERSNRYRQLSMRIYAQG